MFKNRKQSDTNDRTALAGRSEVEGLDMLANLKPGFRIFGIKGRIEKFLLYFLLKRLL